MTRAFTATLLLAVAVTACGEGSGGARGKGSAARGTMTAPEVPPPVDDTARAMRFLAWGLGHQLWMAVMTDDPKAREAAELAAEGLGVKLPPAPRAGDLQRAADYLGTVRVAVGDELARRYGDPVAALLRGALAANMLGMSYAPGRPNPLVDDFEVQMRRASVPPEWWQPFVALVHAEARQDVVHRAAVELTKRMSEGLAP